MITLTNSTKSVSVVGKLVSISTTDPNAFVYAIPNSSRAIGIVTEAVPYRQKCKIATIGDKARVLVSSNINKDDIIRSAKSGDNVSLGNCKVARPLDAPYLKVGVALSSGTGLIPTILELVYQISNDVQSGIVNVTDTTYTVGETDSLIVVNSLVAVSIYLPSSTGNGRVIKIASINTGVVTVYPFGAGTINGELTQEVLEDSCMDVQNYSNNNWVIV